MELFLDFLRVALQGIVREVSAHFFRKTVLERNKTTSTPRQKCKGGLRKY